MNKKFRIFLINGPNLNLLGIREPSKYGNTSFVNLIKMIYKQANELGVFLEHFQSNAEYLLIDNIHKSINNIDFILINPAALAHTSIALRDAMLSVNIPFIEIHLSNIYKCESFRHHSYLSDIALGTICGLGIDSYFFALNIAVKYLNKIVHD